MLTRPPELRSPKLLPRRRPRTRTLTSPSSSAVTAAEGRAQSRSVPALDSGGGQVDSSSSSRAVRLRLDIAYDGTDFTGWALQAGRRTVAGVLDEALSTVFRTSVLSRAAGRTD